MNQQHLLALAPAAFAQVAADYLSPAPLPANFPAIAAAVQEKVRLLEELPVAIDFLVGDDYPHDAEAMAKAAGNPAAAQLAAVAERFATIDPWSADAAKAALGEVAAAAGAKPGQLMFPLRVALSGRGHGPDLGAILDILGRERAVARIRAFTAQLTA
jgi:glutamyl-tRNA synthetase